MDWNLWRHVFMAQNSHWTRSHSTRLCQTKGFPAQTLWEPRVACSPSADFLSSMFWRKTTGQWSTSRFSPLHATQSDIAMCHIAGNNDNAGAFKSESQRFQLQSCDGFVVNPLVEIPNDSRRISEVSSDKIPREWQLLSLTSQGCMSSISSLRAELHYAWPSWACNWCPLVVAPFLLRFQKWSPQKSNFQAVFQILVFKYFWISTVFPL